jgi:predicted signal transduction protein with EAL and GGDEF domain
VGGSVTGRTTCSIGFALYPCVAEPFPQLGWERVLSVADANLYKAKGTRNAWVGCCGAPGMTDVAELATLAEHDLEAAEQKRFVEVRRSAAANDETLERLVRLPPSSNIRQ